MRTSSRARLHNVTGLVAGAVLLAGCAGGGETGALSLPTVQLPKVELPAVDLGKVELPKVELPAAALPVVGSPTDVYTRVARGAVSCWFGASGPLKGRYIYHAEAESPSRGGKAEIAVHERDTTAKDPRGGKALKIFISPEGDGAKVAYENQKLPADLADAMRRDVDRWASGNMGCQPMPESAAWSSVTQQGAGAMPPTPPAKPLRAAKGSR